MRGLVALGRNDCEISRITGVPRTTVRDWRHGRFANARTARTDAAGICDIGHDFAILPADAYCYLLGLYLGDGCISAHRRGVWKIRITLDASYPGIIQECCAALEAIMPGQRAHVLNRAGCVDVSLYSKHWPCLFPQHGPGRKHERPIQLASWQEDFVRQDPKSFLRGLLHSDGCRVTANDRGVKSVRYHFSNRSDDIKNLFCDALDRLAIPWTRPCDRQIAVYRKEAAARLDQFIGPKL